MKLILIRITRSKMFVCNLKGGQPWFKNAGYKPYNCSTIKIMKLIFSKFRIAKIAKNLSDSTKTGEYF